MISWGFDGTWENAEVKFHGMTTGSYGILQDDMGIYEQKNDITPFLRNGNLNAFYIYNMINGYQRVYIIRKYECK